MTKWQEVRLGDVCDVKGGKRLPKGVNLVTIKNTHPYIRVRDLGQGKRLQLNQNYEYVDDETQKIISHYIVSEDDVLISIVGTIGLIGIVGNSLNNANLTENCVKLINLRGIDKDFLYYFLISNSGQDAIKQGTVGAVQAKLPIKNIQTIQILLPPLDVQKKIAGVLGALDDKIELNNRINNNLEQQAQALFKSWFVDKTNPNRKNIKVEEFFNISIGKTPPRKEPEWFSKNPDDIIWVSISDMGNCGTFISNSSEYLTKKAVSKFNIKIVPDNTVLLSFKLTVGRVAITDGNMTTNEAIAHFITGKKEINEYLYCYLKNFNFQTMGSTSSIATAVNSKIIKAMPIVMPTEKELIDFHTVTYPMFLQIKANQQENTRLSALRDTLLPKLMSGEIDVSNVDISALTSTDKSSFRK